MIWFVTKAPPINNIDSKCRTRKLKSSRICLIDYSGFILRKWFLITRGRAHTHTGFLDKSNFKKAVAYRPLAGTRLVLQVNN